jgi:hypothetical protein
MIDLQGLQTDLNLARDLTGSLWRISNIISNGRVGSGKVSVNEFKRRLFVTVVLSAIADRGGYNEMRLNMEYDGQNKI